MILSIDCPNTEGILLAGEKKKQNKIVFWLQTRKHLGTFQISNSKNEFAKYLKKSRILFLRNVVIYVEFKPENIKEKKKGSVLY